MNSALHLPADGVIIDGAGQYHHVGLQHLRQQAIGIILLETTTRLEAAEAADTIV